MWLLNRLIVGSIPHSRKMKYLFTFIFSFLRSGVRGKARRWVQPLNTQCLQNSAERGERSALTLSSLCLPCCLRDTAWSLYNTKEDKLTNLIQIDTIKTGFYQTRDGCRHCHHYCRECNDSGPLHCTSCPSRFMLDGGLCMECLGSQYLETSSGLCRSCDDTCRSCSGPGKYSCSGCSRPLRLDRSVVAAIFFMISHLPFDFFIDFGFNFVL